MLRDTGPVQRRLAFRPRRFPLRRTHRASTVATHSPCRNPTLRTAARTKVTHSRHRATRGLLGRPVGTIDIVFAVLDSSLCCWFVSSVSSARARYTYLLPCSWKLHQQ
ncbi:unnamed protein product [Acanthoscelides obtectus]|uniref:Uncharacterized protein n=1 Tax=Acanthoscelides obtectus TaxID=200917 RepID=A0A9P0Q3U8_ACAOB|nr:unnamed protein product [Acanthoscelides obtectus]CAK1643903.1 hypothetical protein AOBTE_LOCUS13721 [Acanthoscelides obtectus]